jgi:hypothetical protein
MKVTSKSAVFIYIVVLVLVALGFYYVLALRNSDNQPKEAKPNQSIGKTPKVNVPPTADVSKPIEDAYTAYLKAVKNDKQAEALATFKKASTDSLASKLTNDSSEDPVLCSDKVPQKLTFSDPPLMGDITVVSVTAVYENSKEVITVTSDVNTKKIVSIKCPSGKTATKLAPTQ